MIKRAEMEQRIKDHHFTKEEEESLAKARAAMARIQHRKYLLKLVQGTLTDEEEFKSWQAMDPIKVSTAVIAISALLEE